MDSPLVERCGLGVGLQRSFLDDEAHPLEEGGGDGRWLLPQQDVDGVVGAVAKIGLLAGCAGAAFRVLTVREAIWRRRELVNTVRQITCEFRAKQREEDILFHFRRPLTELM